MKRGKVVAAVVRVEEEQDGSTIFGTLFDLPSERKTTKPVDLPPPVYKATKPVDLPPSVLENTRPVDMPPSVNRDKGPPHKECTVCLDTLSKSLFPESLHAEQQHDSDVCSSCYDEHIEAELDNKSPDLISCPQCPHTLTEPEVRKLTQRASTYQKYNDVTSKAYIQQDEEFHACPNAACSWGAFFAKDDGNILNCQMCKARYCLSCEIPFHENQTCEEYLSAEKEKAAAAAQEEREQARQVVQEAAGEQRSLEVVQETTKKCPFPSCGVKIHKIEGCDHMTCSRCKYEFYWLCFASFTEIRSVGNRAHAKDCYWYA